MHQVGFIIRIYHDARSPERQILTVINTHVKTCELLWKGVIAFCYVRE